MLHEAVTDNVLKNFTTDICQGYRAIIGWACLVSFLVNRRNTGLFPAVWEAPLMERGFEK